MAFLKPGDIMDHGGGPCLDAAMIAIDRLVPADRGILEARGFLFGHEDLDILARAVPWLPFNART